MDKLTIPLSALPDKGLPVEATVTEDDLCPEGVNGLSVGSVHVVGHLSRADHDYVFQGDISGEYHHSCDRCLDEAEVPFSVDVVWVFSEHSLETESAELSGSDEDSEGVEDGAFRLTVQDDAIDLKPRVWEEIVLTAPLKYLCREDCAGLCPQCGANLNREVCECRRNNDEKLPNNGLAGLGELFPDLRAKRTKE